MATHDLERPTAPRPGLVSVDGRLYPLESIHIAARAEGGIARTTLTQRFGNPHDEALEVIYVLPLPADGAVLGYVVRIGERVIRGEVQPREKAKAAYHDALFQGRTAGLLEENRADTFRQRLGNLPPRTAADVEIVILQPLRFLGAIQSAAPQWEYRFPMVAAPRYQGEAGRVADADRLDADRDGSGGIPTRAELELDIADDPSIDADAACRTHRVAVERTTHATRVRFAQGERLDRDVAVRWNACTGEVGVRVVEGSGLEGDDGRYALVTVTPPAAPRITYRRDLTVVLDASGSMGGRPLAIACSVAGELLRSLEPEDRFELLAFSNEPRRLTRGLEEAKARNVERALRALDGLRADGGTEMTKAIEEALEPLRVDSQRQIVLLTDGYIGFESQVVDRIAQRSADGVRVHAVGIGAAPNRTLLQGVALAGRGVELSAGDDVTAAEAARRLCAATARPVLADLEIGGSAMRAMAPRRPRDVFAGEPLVFTVELEKEGGTLELRGRLAGEPTPWATRHEVVRVAGTPIGSTTPLPIGALHGRARIADLELAMGRSEARPMALREIESLGMRHRIVSRGTSLVAIAEEPSVDPRAPRRREKLAVELPAGVSAEGAGLATERYKTPMPKGLHLRTLESLSTATMTVFGGRPEPKTGSRVLRVEGDRLFLEIDAPLDGFVLPSGQVMVHFGDGSIGAAELVVEESSPRGPHALGLLVRMVLRLVSDSSWPESGTLDLVWEGRIEGAGGRPVRTPMHVRVELRSAGSVRSDS